MAAQSRPLDHRPARHGGALHPRTARHNGDTHQSARVAGVVVQVLVVRRQVVVVVVVQVEIGVAVVLAAGGATLSPQRWNPRGRGSALLHVVAPTLLQVMLLLLLVVVLELLESSDTALHHGRGLVVMGGRLLVVRGVWRHRGRLLVVVQALVEQRGRAGRMVGLGVVQAVLVQARGCLGGAQITK